MGAVVNFEGGNIVTSSEYLEYHYNWDDSTY